VYTSNKPGSIPCACTTVKKLSRILGRHYDAALSDSGINITQLAVMRCISRRVGDPLARVAHELELEKTSLYRALSPMIRDGWIVLADGPTPGTKTAKITKKGNSIIARAGSGWDEIQDRIISSFGSRQYTIFMQELNRLADCVEQTPAPTVGR
jgi:DNA-binding MarR family transcriptional regulator